MFCERLINIFREYPSFTPVDIIERRLCQEIGVWPASGEERPDASCLEEAWEFGTRQIPERGALPENVAYCISVPIIRGPISPFHGLRPEIVDSHMVTSRSKASLALCKILREVQPVAVAPEGSSPSTLVRGVVLGFRWNDSRDGRRSLESLAASASSADLLLAYRFATAMIADRVSSTDPDLVQSVSDLRTIADGIVGCLKGPGVSRAIEGGDTEARRVVRVIELERVVQAMVDLLTKSGAELDAAMPRIRASLISSGPGGPVSHLREYVARGAPLNDLVGHEQQADVRRDIERIMEPVTENRLPGFPTVKSTSRRASELLRRLRFLVRAILLKATERGSADIYREFRREIFGGAGSDCELEAACIAFERSDGTQGSDGVRSIRAVLQILADKFSFYKCESAVEARDHALVGALRGAVKIELDTWSRVSDGESTSFIQAVADVLRGAESIIPGLAANDLLHRVFEGEVLVAMELEERREDRLPARCNLFATLKPERARDRAFDPRVPVVRRAIQGGLREFQDLIRSNYHREFDREALHKIATMDVFDRFDREQNSKAGKSCREWLESWAYVNVLRSTFDSAKALVGETTTANDLQQAVTEQPYRIDEYSGGSLLFRYADAAADRLQTAALAVEGLLKGASAAQLIDASAWDRLGRSIGMVLSQSASQSLLDHLYGPGRRFTFPLTASIDGVTPTMAAVRFGGGTADDFEQRQRIREVMKLDTLHHGKDPHDHRFWRAIHHAFAAGNIVAVDMLVARDRACLKRQPRDTTTFLIEAMRCRPVGGDPSVVFLKAIDLLSQMEPPEQKAILEFVGTHPGMSGMPLSLVSAALASDGGRWPMLVAALERPEHRESILAVIGERELTKLLRDDDDARFASFCQYLSHAPGGRARIKDFLSNVEPSAAIQVLSLVKSADSAISSQSKCMTLSALESLDLAKSDPFSRDNALHHLVRAVEKRSDADSFAARLYELAWQVIQSERSHEQRRALVSSPNLDGESPIWLASRLGVPSLAVAYAQFLGNIAVSSDERWLEAARVIKEPDRYQDGIPENRRLLTDNERRLCLAVGGGAPRVLSMRPLPADLNVRSARAWLLENSMEIASSLKAHFGLNSDVPHYAFVNWLAHLSSERAPGHGSDR